jgi:hypothetical protein
MYLLRRARLFYLALLAGVSCPQVLLWADPGYVVQRIATGLNQPT